MFSIICFYAQNIAERHVLDLINFETIIFHGQVDVGVVLVELFYSINKQPDLIFFAETQVADIICFFEMIFTYFLRLWDVQLNKFTLT